MKISIICPSRLAVNPASKVGNLFLDRALMSVQRQTVFRDHEFEFVVGLDHGPASIPARFVGEPHGVKFVHAETAGQAAAVNTAVAVSTGEVLAFIEDDDQWYPDKLAVQLPYLESFDLVTSNAREVDLDANFLRINDFAGPSSWVMKRETWVSVGPMDESFRWHVDTEWLGRVSREFDKYPQRDRRRIHVVEQGALSQMRAEPTKRPWLVNIAQHSEIVESPDRSEPLIARTVNPDGGMERIKIDRGLWGESMFEHGRMVERFGSVPW